MQRKPSERIKSKNKNWLKLIGSKIMKKQFSKVSIEIFTKILQNYITVKIYL